MLVGRSFPCRFPFPAHLHIGIDEEQVRGYHRLQTIRRKEHQPMWAQLIKMRLKPGKEAGLESLLEHLRATEQPGSGLVRSTTMTDQKDPSVVYTMVVFESEEQAR